MDKNLATKTNEIREELSQKVIKPCPWCGKIPVIVPCDDEGNIHTEEGYEENPWSGLGYLILHEQPYDIKCVIATHPADGTALGRTIYDSREDAIAAWNSRMK